jgi:hypothetical protein
LLAGSALSILMAGTALGDVAPVPRRSRTASFRRPISSAGCCAAQVSYARMVADIRYGALEVDGCAAA